MQVDRTLRHGNLEGLVVEAGHVQLGFAVDEVLKLPNPETSQSSFQMIEEGMRQPAQQFVAANSRTIASVTIVPGGSCDRPAIWVPPAVTRQIGTAPNALPSTPPRRGVA